MSQPSQNHQPRDSLWHTLCLCAAVVVITCIFVAVLLTAGFLGAAVGKVFLGGHYGALIGTAFTTLLFVTLGARLLAGNTSCEAGCTGITTAIVASAVVAMLDQMDEVDRWVAWLGW